MIYLTVISLIWSLGLTIALRRFRNQGVNSVGVVASHECAISDLCRKLEYQNRVIHGSCTNVLLLAEQSSDLDKRVHRLELRDIVHYETIQ